MGCGGRKPCACSDCGPFVVSSKGRFQTLDGRSMGANIVRPDWHKGFRRRPAMGAEGELRPPFGRRDAMASAPLDVGRPAPDVGTYVPLGAEFEASWSPPKREATAEASRASDPAAMAALPIGARPSVPARLDVDFHRTGETAAILREPYGLLPLSLSESSVYGTGADTGFLDMGAVPPADLTASDLSLVTPMSQFVPPPPAPQGMCLVNGFNPSWGTPPSTYRGVVMRFDPRYGAYHFSPDSRDFERAFLESGDENLVRWYDEVANRYRSGFMLQPFRTDGGTGAWQYRWIPRRQDVICT